MKIQASQKKHPSYLKLFLFQLIALIALFKIALLCKENGFEILNVIFGVLTVLQLFSFIVSTALYDDMIKYANKVEMMKPIVIKHS